MSILFDLFIIASALAVACLGFVVLGIICDYVMANPKLYHFIERRFDI